MMVEEVRKAGDHIKNGRIILYPTDTIWGIGCDATDPRAVQKVYNIKQRSDRKSMLVLMDGPIMLSRYLDKIPDQALKILNSTDNPTTIIYPDAKNLAENLIAEDGSIGIRITSDPFCRQLIERTGKPIVSTSANISGKPSPSLFSEIEPQLLKFIDYVVNWRQEETSPTNPSTILKLDEHGEITVIRP